MARKEVGFSPEGAIRASGFCRACRKQEEGQAGETREGGAREERLPEGRCALCKRDRLEGKEL